MCAEFNYLAHTRGGRGVGGPAAPPDSGRLGTPEGVPLRKCFSLTQTFRARGRVGPAAGSRAHLAESQSHLRWPRGGPERADSGICPLCRTENLVKARDLSRAAPPDLAGWLLGGGRGPRPALLPVGVRKPAVPNVGTGRSENLDPTRARSRHCSSESRTGGPCK